jgi:hypothetical protein
MKQQAAKPASAPEKFVAAVTRLFEDPQPLHLEMEKMTAWHILSTIQLACRHPEFKGATRDQVEHFARQLGEALTANDPDLRLLFNMGWEENLDEPPK